MKKTLIFLVSISFAVIAMLVGTGCSGTSSDANEIDKVIVQYCKIGSEGLRENSTKEDILRYFGHVTSEMRRIDTSRCPQDFRVAYEHLSMAHENLYATLQTMPVGLLSNLGNLLTGSKFEKNADEAMKRIYESFDEVNLVAARHGAKERIEKFE